MVATFRMVRQKHSLAQMTAVWLLPVVTLVVTSSSGGLLARALLPHSTSLALITTGFSFTMVLIGLSLAIMLIAVYLVRLITYGAPDPGIVLSTFVTLGMQKTVTNHTTVEFQLM
jgi:tellurite resistance protein TehA-like permease